MDPNSSSDPGTSAFLAFALGGQAAADTSGSGESGQRKKGIKGKGKAKAGKRAKLEDGEDEMELDEEEEESIGEDMGFGDDWNDVRARAALCWFGVRVGGRRGRSRAGTDGNGLRHMTCGVGCYPARPQK